MRISSSSVAVLAAVFASFSLAGCMVEHDEQEEAADATSESEDALALASLYGTWNGDSGLIHSITFSKDAAQTLGGFLKGRKFSANIDTGVRCVTTPCPSDTDVAGVYKLTSGTKLTLASYDKPSLAFSKILGDYSVKLNGSTLTLTKRDGSGKQTFHKAQPCGPNTKLCTKGSHYDNTPGVCGCVPNAPGYCATDADCRLVDDYCTGCDCRALSSSEELSACAGPGVRCFAAPCGGQTAACVQNTCVAQ